MIQHRADQISQLNSLAEPLAVSDPERFLERLAEGEAKDETRDALSFDCVTPFTRGPNRSCRPSRSLIPRNAALDSKSTTAGFLALREAVLTAGTTVLLVSPSLRQSGELFRRTMDGLNRLGRPVRVVAESALRAELANGSRVVSLPGTEHTVRGYTAGMVVLDEAARILERYELGRVP